MTKRPTWLKPNRLPYEKAVMLRPRGACYCDHDDRTCYELGHWEAQVSAPVAWHQREAGGLVTLVAVGLFIAAAAVWSDALRVVMQ